MLFESVKKERNLSPSGENMIANYWLKNQATALKQQH